MAHWEGRGRFSKFDMALVNIPQNDRKRVKVYELRNNDWFDRGTGFCTGQVVEVRIQIHNFADRGPSAIY